MQILLLTAGAITLLLVILFLVNRFLLNNIWKPFFFTLSEMKQFNLARPEKLNRLSNNIDEFNALDATLSQMVEKVRKDYSSLKSFADNASHEMQTPLAIINSKLDLLIQDQHLNEKNMHDLQGIYESLDKLSKLNQSLLLMARIENNQFVEKKPVQLHRLIEQRLEELEELIHARGLSVITNLKPAVADMHPLLADILINNLLVNAIRHNTFEGMIKLESTANKITVINTASGTALDEKTLFDRFRKSLESDGVGLGLAIVKEICEFYQFQVSYAYLSPLHYFTFTFKNGTTGSKS